MVKSTLAIAAVCAMSCNTVFSAEVKMLSGAGASFPYPLYAKWAQAYFDKTGVQLNYQSIGSGGGIKQIKAQTVDFGASDSPLQPAALIEAGLVQFPTVLGGVVPVVNLQGIKPGDLKLSSEVLADLFLGDIKTWNDPRIATLNPGIKLPATQVIVVHRADGSGTTWIFTNYLSKVSPKWAKDVGNDIAVSWPAGVGGKGNEGLASLVGRLDGAIGYVEYAYTVQNKLTFTKLQNRAGKFVGPTIETFQAAAAQAKWESAPGFYMILTDQPGDATWPIVGATFILMHGDQNAPDTARAVLDFFDWAYKSGDQMAQELDYVPLPDKVVGLIHQEWQTQIKGPTGQPVWSP
jgi:phosphate transport system substrate-binding protein